MCQTLPSKSSCDIDNNWGMQFICVSKFEISFENFGFRSRFSLGFSDFYLPFRYVYGVFLSFKSVFSDSTTILN